MDASVFTLLMLAHLVADFYLQSSRMVENKKTDKKFISANIVHSIIVTATVFAVPLVMYSIELGMQLFIETWQHTNNWLVLYIKWQFFTIIGIVFISHMLIDFIKSFAARYLDLTPLKQASLFIVDQVLHIITLIVISAMFDTVIQLNSKYLFVICLLLINKPAGVLISYILRIYLVNSGKNDKSSDDMKLGRQIGYVERTFVFISIIFNLETIAATVITLKGVLRISGSNSGEQEYIIYGNLISFFIAVLTALVFVS